MSWLNNSWGWVVFFSPKKVLSIIWGNIHYLCGREQQMARDFFLHMEKTIQCMLIREFCGFWSVQELPGLLLWLGSVQIPSHILALDMNWESAEQLLHWAGLLHSCSVASALCLWSFTDRGWFGLCFFKKKSCCITCISNQLGSCHSNRMARLFMSLGIEQRRAGIILTSWWNQLSMYLTLQLSYIKRQCLTW